MTAGQNDEAARQTEGQMGIAELAERAGVTPRTIRYYVAEGLLPAPGGRGQHRAYREEHLRKLETIRQLKAAYLPLHEIRRRLADPPSPSHLPGATVENPSPPDPLSRARERGSRLDAAGSSSSAVPPRGMSTPGEALVALPGATVDRQIAVASAEARLPFGFGRQPNVGRIEIYDPPETVWRRHVLAPGVELHYRETDDPKLAEAIQRLLREAAAMLDADRPSRSGDPSQVRAPQPQP